MSQLPSITIAGIVLAAGKGTRMKSDLPKVLHPLCGAPLAQFVLNALAIAGVKRPVVVVGHRADLVEETLGERNEYVLQEPQLGTGHAVMQAAPLLSNFTGPIIIAPGDAPLVTGDVLSELVETHIKSSASCTLATCVVDNPFGYGRVIRDKAGAVIRIVEQKDATDEQKKIKEINTSFYCFDAKALFETLPKLTNKNAQSEYYLTDVVAALASTGQKVCGFEVADSELLIGVNSRWELAQAAQVMRTRIAKKLAEDGVTIIDPQTTYIDFGVEVGIDTIIQPMTILEGKTKIGGECTIGPFSRIIDSVIGDRVRFQNSTANGAYIEDEVRVGPFANLRNGAVLRTRSSVGDFVEIKNSELGPKVAAGHLSYIGDSFIGEGTNIGAGTITCNYDGKRKHRTKIGKRVFIGSNTTLVAPVEVGDDVVIAAGSTITDDIPEESLGIARSRQIIKEGWTKKWHNQD
ncbi:MAG: bifunctional UDP-N-acetylglucosamine diphosphorylase/glucosamine-1-phosphate N-acetyltransferase GlmU [bacterium]